MKMSHTVTVTRTTTMASSSVIMLNTGYLRSVSGILKLFETVVGAICLGLIAYYWFPDRQYPEETLFFLVTYGCLMTTFLLFISSIGSLATSSILPKTYFETVYHFVSFIMYLSASVALMVAVTNKGRGYSRSFRGDAYEAKLAAAALGILNTLLYLLSTIFSCRTYRIG